MDFGPVDFGLTAGSLSTPIGELVLVHRGDRLCLAEFADSDARIRQLLRRYFDAELPALTGPLPITQQCFAQYFTGALRALDALPLLTKGTGFQEKVWHVLLQTRPGERHAYGNFAKRIGHPRAQRAVGHANGRNPIAIAIPCHRLLGSNGELTGYGGGLDRKAWLLDHEARATGANGPPSHPLHVA